MSSFADLYRGIAVEPATAVTLQALKEEEKLDCPICHLPFVELQQFFPKRPTSTACVGLIPTRLITPFIDHPKEPHPQNPIKVLTSTHRRPASATPITLKACNHTCCSSCLIDWLYSNLLVGQNTCPCCRTSLAIPKPSNCIRLTSGIRASYSSSDFDSNPTSFVEQSLTAYASAAADDDNTDPYVHFNLLLLQLACMHAVTTSDATRTHEPTTRANAPWRTPTCIWVNMKHIYFKRATENVSLPLHRHEALPYSRETWLPCNRTPGCYGTVAPAAELRRALLLELYEQELLHSMRLTPSKHVVTAEALRRIQRVRSADGFRLVEEEVRTNAEWARVEQCVRMMIGWLVLQTRKATA